MGDKSGSDPDFRLARQADLRCEKLLAQAREVDPRSAQLGKHFVFLFLHVVLDVLAEYGEGRRVLRILAELRRMIEEAAYYRAEKRGFAPGLEAQDWCEAEVEVSARVRALQSTI